MSIDAHEAIRNTLAAYCFAADAAGTKPATGSEYIQRIRGKTLSQIRQKALADPHST